MHIDRAATMRHARLSMFVPSLTASPGRRPRCRRCGAGPPPGGTPVPDAPLPSAQPPAAPRVVARTDAAHPGLTLYAPLNEQAHGPHGPRWNTVHEWKHDLSPGQACYLLADGSLLRCARGEKNEVFGGGGEGGRIERWTWEGERIWSFDIDDATRLSHHDIAPLPTAISSPLHGS
jgi:hypothetical protein